MVLRVTGLEVRYGVIPAVKGVSFAVPRGRLHVIVGANGAGKTTTLKAITGLIRASGGTVELGGRPIHRLPAHEIARAGIAMVPEGRRVFAKMSVYENLLMGSFAQRGDPRLKQRMEAVLERFPRLRERTSQLAGTLSGGEQQMLAIARGLMAEPKLLLLDEPSLGLAPMLLEEVFAIIKRINDDGVTVLMVEQNSQQGLQVANWAYVMELGQIVVQDEARRLLDSDEVRRAYLGG
ncbi:MAG: ABC transporter ATP-binding protein [Chloroflexi bacterium]|nr:ABC transporter ATP-binding protein [Chloroflexota bacterium]MBI4507307.1 ABC transporter ATP-binding protein [Chloroflexota bacterium]